MSFNSGGFWDNSGTPVGTGGYSDPQRYLQDGDVIRVEVEGLTGLANPVVQA